MNNHIKHIVNYFFRHRISDELARKVYQQIKIADEEQKETMEKVYTELWDEQEGATCTPKEMNQALQRLEKRLAFSPQPQKVHFTWWRVAAIWLLPLLALGGSFYYYQRAERLVMNGQKQITYQQCYASTGTREQLILPDSSIVWLNAGSLLIYPTDFTRHRNVYLQGEGYFDVRKNEQHPFVVSSQHLSLKVLGTRFNVSAYPESEQLTTTLESGCVNITILANQRQYTLHPNDQLIYTPTTQEVQCQRVDAAKFSEWRKGGLFLNDMVLSDVFKTLERTYGVTMHLANSAYQSQRVRVWFNKDESIDNVLRIIRMLVPGINYTIHDKEIYWK